MVGVVPRTYLPAPLCVSPLAAPNLFGGRKTRASRFGCVCRLL